MGMGLTMSRVSRHPMPPPPPNGYGSPPPCGVVVVVEVVAPPHRGVVLGPSSFQVC